MHAKIVALGNFIRGVLLSLMFTIIKSYNLKFLKVGKIFASNDTVWL